MDHSNILSARRRLAVKQDRVGSLFPTLRVPMSLNIDRKRLPTLSVADAADCIRPTS